MSVIAYCDTLPEGDVKRSICPQLLDSAGSVSSNYREACRARSTKEFISKVGIACQEAEESKGWLKALADVGICSDQGAQPLIDEADQLTRF